MGWKKMYIVVVGRAWLKYSLQGEFLEADLQKWDKNIKKVQEQCKIRGSKLVAATQFKVLTQKDMELPEYLKNADKSPMHLVGQTTPKTWLSCRNVTGQI